MKYEIDNPGGGDCGFYAFAISLIEIIQNEHHAKRVSPTFKKWQEKGLDGVDLDSLLKVDLHRLRQDPNHYEKALLSLLQRSLRSIAAESSKKDLEQRVEFERIQYATPNLTEVEGSPIFGKFSELVKAYVNGGTSAKLSTDFYNFNELALSPKVRQLAQQTAIELKPLLKDKSFAEQQKIENTYIKEALIADWQAKPKSCILEGIDSIKKPGRWATHSDLNVIAAELNVNLLVNSVVNGAVEASWPTATLNNKGNKHWTTTVDIPEPKLRIEPLEPRARTVKAKQTEELSSREEQVLAATVSSQVHEDKVAPYKQHLKTLIHAAASQGLFAKVVDKIDVTDLDQAKANDGETDEEFALRLQEAEYRGSGLK